MKQEQIYVYKNPQPRTVIQHGDRMSKKLIPTEVVVVDETNTDSSAILKSPSELIIAQAA